MIDRAGMRPLFWAAAVRHAISNSTQTSGLRTPRKNAYDRAVMWVMHDTVARDAMDHAVDLAEHAVRAGAVPSVP